MLNSLKEVPSVNNKVLITDVDSAYCRIRLFLDNTELPSIIQNYEHIKYNYTSADRYEDQHNKTSWLRQIKAVTHT